MTPGVRPAVLGCLLAMLLLVAALATGAAAQDTIFGSSTPAAIDSGDGHSVELGVKFSSEVAGSASGIRFYKASTNTGTHLGSLWTASGTLLASVTFTGESASGWQQATFAKPVAIAANTTYVAGYLAPKGHYSDTSSAFAFSGVSSPPLQALANTTSANGVYAYSSTSTFPQSTYKATNYWVDVDFEPSSGEPPAQVTNVHANAGNGTAGVSWTAPAGGGATITSYTITPYVGTQAQTATTITGNPPATSATVTGLTNGVSYTFRVAATNANGTGPASEQSNAVTPSTTPSAPTGVKAAAGNGSAAISWSAPSTGGSTITSYTITPYIGTEAQAPTTITGTPPATSATITGLTNGTAYTFRVAATNANGTGPASEQSNAVAPSTTPSAPTGVKAAAGNGSAAISWSAPSTGGSTITSYTITPYIGTEAQAPTTITGTPPATSATITGLTNGTSYTFTVIAANTNGNGPASEASNAVTPGVPPSAPTNVTATAGDATAAVTWTAPATGGSPITSYTITPHVGSEARTATTITGSPPASTVTINGLTNGTSYTFTVSAANGTGQGVESAQSNPVTPSGGAIAYPDLRVLVPTNEIYVVQNGGTRTLEFTHISSDLGAGPLEIRPSYNASTGISQGYQALYTRPSPGVWQFDHTVPIVGPMLWRAPSDYNYPLVKFWLYNSTAGGGPGSVVATSPKADFCMTSDTFVGGVPETPAKNGYPSSACSEPEGTLGLSVGWGDQYDATDAGEGISVSSLPDGTYWLRAEIDPDHYLQESNLANDITDTKLQLEAGKVTVLEQDHPDSTPPSVTLLAPGAGAKLSTPVTLEASASGPAAISSVQFLLDGQPVGSPVTSPPYSLTWSPGSTTVGKHLLSAQATDANGFIGTAADVPVTVESEQTSGEPPTVAITNPTAGQIVGNTVPVAATASAGAGVASVQFFLDGAALSAPVTTAPYAVSWNTATASNGVHTLTATVTDDAGQVGKSAPVTLTVQNPVEEGPCFVMDAKVSARGNGAVTTAPFTTNEAGEQLLALVGSDGPHKKAGQAVTVSGAGLVWIRVAQAHAQYGDAEIWTATTTAPLSGVTVTSTPSVGGYDQSLTVIAMEMSNGVGASAVASAATGAPKVSLVTTEAGSLVFAVGNDYTAARARTVGPNQVILDEDLDSATGDTYWSQYTGQITGEAGTTVTMNDTAPTGDTWNLAAVELLGDGLGK